MGHCSAAFQPPYAAIALGRGAAYHPSYVRGPTIQPPDSAAALVRRSALVHGSAAQPTRGAAAVIRSASGQPTRGATALVHGAPAFRPAASLVCCNPAIEASGTYGGVQRWGERKPRHAEHTLRKGSDQVMNGGELPSSRSDGEFDLYNIVIGGRRYVVRRRRYRRFEPFSEDDYTYNLDRHQDQLNWPPPNKRARVVPITDAAINRSLREVTPAKLLQTECAVCLKDLDAEGDKLSAMRCDHAFHHDCIVPWLRRNAVCPLCRSPLLPPPAQQQRQEAED
ncbi:hypothetical protein EJB05_29741, partial [Eragrostis curvula]